MFKRLFLAAVAALGMLPAEGAIQFYGGTTGLTETDFANQVLTLGLTMQGPIYFTGEASGTMITDVGPTGVDFSAPSTINVVGNPAQYVALNIGDSLRIDFPGDVYAFGIHLSKVTSSSTGTWNFGPLGGPSAGSITIPSSGTVFLGVISTTPLSSMPSIVLTSTGSSNRAFTMEDFSIGTLAAAPTPEPSTFVLLGAALIVLPLWARRRGGARCGRG